MRTEPLATESQPPPRGVLGLQGFRMLLGSVAVSEAGTQISVVAILTYVRPVSRAVARLRHCDTLGL